MQQYNLHPVSKLSRSPSSRSSGSPPNHNMSPPSSHLPPIQHSLTAPFHGSPSYARGSDSLASRRPCRRSQSFASFVRVNARGVDFPRVRFSDHSFAPPPRLCTSTHKGSTSRVSALAITAAPRLCTSMHEGSTSLASASAITAAPPSFARQRTRGRLPACQRW